MIVYGCHLCCWSDIKSSCSIYVKWVCSLKEKPIVGKMLFHFNRDLIEIEHLQITFVMLYIFIFQDYL